jgi:hypothetical protein
MATMIVSPGTSGAFPELTLKVTGDTTGLVVATMQDVTVNASNDIFTWTQLNAAGKFQIPTTSTNSISLNMVVDQDAFFGVTTVGEAAKSAGIFGLSNGKTKVNFSFTMASSNGTDKVISGEGYITGLAPTVSADSPVWVTPVTLTVLGNFTVA